MINYLFEYTPGSAVRPEWIKTVTDSATGEVVRTELNFFNSAERSVLTTEQVYAHLGNLVQYIKDVSQNLAPIAMEDSLPADGWHIKGGWGEIEWAKEETLRWWESVYYSEGIPFAEAVEAAENDV